MLENFVYFTKTSGKCHPLEYISTEEECKKAAKSQFNKNSISTENTNQQKKE